MKKILKNRNGFSLAEVLIVVAIAAVLVVVVSNFGTNTSALNGLISSNLQSKSDVAQTLQIVASEIRGAEPSAAGAYPIVSAGTSTFSFYSDVYGTGAADFISYTLTSSTMYRTLIEPTGTPATYPTSSETVSDLVDNVSLVSSTPLFSYYGSSYTGSGAALTSPVTISSVRLVQVTLESIAETNPSQPSPPQYFSTLVDLRNLDSN